MFDFSFSEVALIGVVALVVIGPERLPRVARTAGVMVNRAQRYATAVRADIEREVAMSEVRRVQDELQSAAQSFQSGVRDSLARVESEFEQSRAAVMTGPAPGARDEPVTDRLEAPAPAHALAPLPVVTPAQASPLALDAPTGHDTVTSVDASRQAARHDLGARLTYTPPPASSGMGWERLLGPAATRQRPASVAAPSPADVSDA